MARRNLSLMLMLALCSVWRLCAETRIELSDERYIDTSTWQGAMVGCVWDAGGG